MGKVLVIADPEGECNAIPRGLLLADRLGLDAEVYGFVHTSLAQLKLDGDARAEVRKRLQSKRETELQGSIDQHGNAGQKVKLRVLWEKDVAGWVCQRCARSKYRMVVKTGRRTESLVHTSTDWMLLRDCPAPVLIVAENKWRQTRPVLAALDLASSSAVKKHLNEAILEQAGALATAMGESLAIICAVEVPTLLQDLDLVDPRSYVAQLRQAMQPQISALARRHALPEKAFRVKRGPAEKVITSEAAKQRAQLVVMGTVGRKGVKGRLIGNTAEKVLRHLHTDVLALKPSTGSRSGG